jgi:hypothetical protein
MKEEEEKERREVWRRQQEKLSTEENLHYAMKTYEGVDI